VGRPPDTARREEVLDQVIGYVAEHGLSTLTLRTVSASLGVSTTVITYQFGSKAGLVEAALLRSRSAQRAVYERLRERDPAATTAEGFVAIWDWWMEDPRHLAYSRMSIEAMVNSALPTPATRKSLLAYWVGYFADWLSEDGHPHDVAVDLATLLLSVQSGLILDVITGGDRARITDAMHRFAATLDPPRARRR
jgi:AcrR family transcriptional regulator